MVRIGYQQGNPLTRVLKTDRSSLAKQSKYNLERENSYPFTRHSVFVGGITGKFSLRF